MTSLGMGPVAVIERVDIGDNPDGEVHWHPSLGSLDTVPSLPVHMFQVAPYYSRNLLLPHLQSVKTEGSFDCRKATRLVTHNLVAYMNLLEVVDSSLHNNGAEPVRRLDMDNVAGLVYSCSPLGRILDPSFACQEILPKDPSSLPSFDNHVFPEPPDTLERLDKGLACAYVPTVAAEYNNRFLAKLALLEYNHPPAQTLPELAVQLAFSSSF